MWCCWFRILNDAKFSRRSIWPKHRQIVSSALKPLSISSDDNLLSLNTQSAVDSENTLTIVECFCIRSVEIWYISSENNRLVWLESYILSCLLSIISLAVRNFIPELSVYSCKADNNAKSWNSCQSRPSNSAKGALTTSAIFTNNQRPQSVGDSVYKTAMVPRPPRDSSSWRHRHIRRCRSSPVIDKVTTVYLFNPIT